MSQPIAGQIPRMSKVGVLVFTADPLEGGARPLKLAEEVREMREMVRAAHHRDAVDFDVRWATRPRDLLQALNEKHPEVVQFSDSEVSPQVVHFSGHGRAAGLIFTGEGDVAHPLGEEVLAELFRLFRGDIRVVVLNACFSRPHAEAIAEVIGCAIGTPNEISDGAAITFAGAFYSAIAFGRSVREAFDQARLALRMEYYEEKEYPELALRPGIDPDELILVRPEARESGPITAPESLAPPVTIPTASENSTPNNEVSIRKDPAAPQGLVFLVTVWMLSHFAARLLVHNPLEAILVSLVPLAITFALLNFASDDQGRLRFSVKVAALVLAAISVFVGAIFVNSELETAKRHYSLGHYDGAFTRFKELAEEGNSEAKGFLGIMYMSGEGTRQNDSVGFYWLTEAAKDGDPRGMYALGIAYETGEGAAPNPREAMRWYADAERKGYADAMNKIGELYRRGAPGITQNYNSALQWFGKAAHGGSVDGMSNLAFMHELGLAGTPNLDEALRWHRRGAQAGSTRAMVDLGWVHEHGIGVRANPDSAAYWYLQAAQAEDKFGMNNLAVLYATGRGVPRRDCPAARDWFRKAADLDLPEARENLARIGDCRP